MNARSQSTHWYVTRLAPSSRTRAFIARFGVTAEHVANPPQAANAEASNLNGEGTVWLGVGGKKSHNSFTNRMQCTKTRRASRPRVLRYSLAGSFVCRTLVSRQNRNSPDATTTTEPSASARLGTSPQIAKPRALAQMSE